MNWIMAALLSPFIFAAWLASVVWIALQAGWMAGDHFMETHFGSRP